MPSNKIVISVPSLAGGGAERVACIWANLLCRNNFDVTLLIFNRSESEYPICDKIKILSLADNISEYKKMNVFSKYLIIKKAINEIKPNYIISFLHASQVWMMLCTLGSSCKRVDTVRINPWKMEFKYFFQKFLWLLSYRLSYKIIIQSKDQISFFSKINQRKCIVIPNPIESERILTSITKFDRVSNFIAVGRIDPQKNYPMMIKAFSIICKKYHYFKLKIFGSGESNYVNYIQKLIVDLGMKDNIFLMGRTREIDKQYRKSHVFLLTSDYEGMPNALIEAMSNGLICISTKCLTGPSDLITDGVNGFLVNTNDIDMLVRKIYKISNLDKTTADNIRSEAVKKIKLYCSIDNNLNKLKEILCN